MTLTGQTPEQRAFTMRMENQIDASLSDAAKMKQVKEKYATSFDADHVLTDEDIRTLAAEAEKHAFIHENMEVYMKAYFPREASGIVTDTFICDNGGFESDFQYYRGYSGLFKVGSNTCEPYYDGLPSTFNPALLPTVRRLEIATSGTDPLTGIQKVRFGNKSLKINDKYGHASGCNNSNYGLDKIVKRFKVSREYLDFTVWYALALENPEGHINSQPFFSIKCDLAPDSDLCFDADILKCGRLYEDACTFDTIDVLDWTCHRIKIPETAIGKIATLEIMVGDCGQGAHFGYAYIDGICEECTGSTLGSITLYDNRYDGEVGIEYYNCDKNIDTIATVCGRYTYPLLCADNWKVDSIRIIGYPSISITIDTVNRIFCFDVPIRYYNTTSCIDLTAEIFFSSGSSTVPVQISNTIEVCKENYFNYDYEVIVGDCKDNGTEMMLSDDYYYVTVHIVDPQNKGWEIERKLEDPYPGESGRYSLQTGMGSTTLHLGPFLIQEGCWDIDVIFEGCTYSEQICPPEYCSGCDAFAGLKISNIKCYPGSPDTWSYDIYVPGSGNYKLNGAVKNMGTTHTIDAGNITQNCIIFELENISAQICNKNITICPPKPCSESNCDFEVYQLDVICDGNGINYMVKFFINNPDNLTLCYKMAGLSLTPGKLLPASKIISLPTGASQVVIYDCNNPDCYKVINIADTGCNDSGDSNIGFRTRKADKYELIIVPNPFSLDEVTIHSTLKKTTYTIFDSLGKMINEGSFDGMYQNIKIRGSAGIYHLMYMDADGHQKSVRIIKQ